ncbi:chromosome condensation regulator RCC1 [Nitzschia inconspicua]|uniref:Chromosome condensation regulator RCC1 n=1 Tax=Nitzschia inconspicua TaxID=303405 RepID=A0A9K3KB46_9STRA|nr:chromosome condensation regulator RCC1 [Nitzschia inconspicua]
MVFHFQKVLTDKTAMQVVGYPPDPSSIFEANLDGDGIGDLCDEDDEDHGDDVMNAMDNCPRVPNGDDSDLDGDGVVGDVVCENCPGIFNPDQLDSNGGDGIGRDACTSDRPLEKTR